VMFITSGVAQTATAYWGAYAASKAAVENMARTYAAELNKTNVKINVLNPGAIRTAMRAKAFPGEDPETLRPPEVIAEDILALAVPGCTLNGEVIQTQ